MKIRSLMLVLGLVSILSPRMAAGIEETDAGEAAARFQRAVDMYREGGYEGALAEFRKAYQISPSYRVLYNIAQAQYALHDFVGAYKSLTQYVNEGGAEISSDRHQQVDEMFGKLSERIARIHVTTTVNGADIRIDNVSVGTSPLPEPVSVNVGTRKVSAFKAGSPEMSRMVTVAGKENLKIELRMDEPSQPVSAAANSSKSLPVTVTTEARSEPSRIPLILSVSVAVTCAAATGVFGYLALDAQKKFKDQVKTFPNSRAEIEDARAQSKRYAYLADGFGAATVVSGSIALYLALTHHWSKPKSAKPIKEVVFAPTLGGIAVQGAF
jgi:tetratricopeptide (TPR) repeat protein